MSPIQRGPQCSLAETEGRHHGQLCGRMAAGSLPAKVCLVVLGSVQYQASQKQTQDPGTARVLAPGFDSSPSKPQRSAIGHFMEYRTATFWGGESGVSLLQWGSRKSPLPRPPHLGPGSDQSSAFYSEEEEEMAIGQCPKPTCFPVAASKCLDLGCGVAVVMSIPASSLP